ncbi:ORFL220C, partial [Human betaherpesvirus 5]
IAHRQRTALQTPDPNTGAFPYSERICFRSASSRFLRLTLMTHASYLVCFE